MAGLPSVLLPGPITSLESITCSDAEEDYVLPWRTITAKTDPIYCVCLPLEHPIALSFSAL